MKKIGIRNMKSRLLAVIMCLMMTVSVVMSYGIAFADEDDADTGAGVVNAATEEENSDAGDVTSDAALDIGNLTSETDSETGDVTLETDSLAGLESEGDLPAEPVAEPEPIVDNSDGAAQTEEGTISALSGEITALAYDSSQWFDAGTEYVYTGSNGNAANNPEAVMTGTELETALDYIGAYEENKPYVIYIGATTIQLTQRYTITDKNIELRKSGSDVTIYPIAASATKNAARHFYITGTKSKFVLESGISLHGGYTEAKISTVDDDPWRGGILSDASVFYFDGEIQYCAASMGGAISVASAASTASATYVLELGGNTKLHHNMAYYNATNNGIGGAICEDNWNYREIQVAVGGNAIIEENYSQYYGGGIAIGYVQAVRNTQKVTVKDNAKIQKNHAASGGGIFAHYGIITVQDNALITENAADRAVPRGSASVYAGSGGGVYISGWTGTGSVNINGNAKITNNMAIRGGGGIAAGYTIDTSNRITLNLNGGEISGNRALGTWRELVSGYTTFDEASIGSGGGILTANRTKIIIPASSTVTFSDNWAPYLTLVERSKLTAGGAITGVNDNYISHIEAPYTDTGNSLTTSNATYNHLYNNYDIGIREAEFAVGANGKSYSKINIVNSPGGSLTQTPEQIGQYSSILGDGTTAAPVGTALQFTAEADAGYKFDGWTTVPNIYTPSYPTFAADSTFESEPALLEDEWTSALTGTVFTSSVLKLAMPPAEVTIKPQFTHLADLTGLADLNFSANNSGVDTQDYVRPLAQNIVIANASGNLDATSVDLSLVGGESGNFTLTPPGAPTPIAGGASATWSLQPNASLTSGLHTVTLRLTYNDGNESKTKEATVRFIVADNIDPVLDVTAAPTFADVVGTGYSPAGSLLTVQSNGTVAATGVDINFTGPNSTDFNCTPSGIISSIPLGSSQSWTITPAAGLGVGTHTATIEITYDPGSKKETVDISFTVKAPALLTAALSPVGSFAQQYEGYVSNPLKAIVFTNTGGTSGNITTIDYTTAGSSALSAFSIQPGVATVPASGSTNDWTIVPKTGLAASVYTETFTVNYSDGTGTPRTTTFTASFTVKAWTAPTGTIKLGTNWFTSFLNTITFGHFFKTTRSVTIEASSVDGENVEIRYLLADTAFVNETAAKNAAGWTNYASPLNINPNNKKIIYAKLTGESSGLITIINSEGIVVYTDSTQDTANISYLKDTLTDVPATVNLNGNTIQKIMNGSNTLLAGTAYSVSSNIITFSAASYLEALSAGNHTLTVYYNPLGEDYANASGTGNEAPATTTINLTVSVPVQITGFVNPTSVIAGREGDLADDTANENNTKYGNVSKAEATLLTLYPTVTANYAGGMVSIPVTAWTWVNTGTPYNSLLSGEYTFEATLGTIPTGYANAGAYKARVTVIINDVLHGITLGQSGVYPIGTAQYGYTPADYTHAVSITNIGVNPTGELKATLTGANPGSFTLSSDIISSIAIGGSSTALTVTPKEGLTPGTYTAKLTISHNNDGNTDLISKEYDVSFTVTDSQITGFEAIADIQAGIVTQTAYADAAAVIAMLNADYSSVTAMHAKGTVPVPTTNWIDTDGYNPNVAGSYTFTAVIGTLPAHYLNDGGYTATIEIVVAGPVFKEFKDATTGIIVSGIFTKVPITLVVNPLSTNEADYILLKHPDKDAILAQEIHFEPDYQLAAGEKLSISFPTPSGVANESEVLLVRHKLPSGSIEEFSPAVSGGFAKVTVGSLSPFIVHKDVKAVVDDENNNDNNNNNDNDDSDNGDSDDEDDNSSVSDNDNDSEAGDSIKPPKTGGDFPLEAMLTIALSSLTLLLFLLFVLRRKTKEQKAA
jgi:hypothetical protein